MFIIAITKLQLDTVAGLEGGRCPDLAGFRRRALGMKSKGREG